MRNKVLELPEKSTTTVEDVLRGGKIKINPKDTAAVETVKGIYEQIGALAVSIDTAKMAQKKIKSKIAASEDGKKLQGVNDKLKNDKKRFNELLSMYKGQLLLCKKQNTVLPDNIVNPKLLNS